jgi:cyclophilin family peptidyl-prolyl cis-trans isomerase
MRFLRFALLAVLLSLAACGTPTDNLSGANEYSTGSEAEAPAASTVASAPAASAAAQAGGNDPASRNNKYSAAPEMQIDANKSYAATIDTTAGVMKVELYPQEAPVAVNNFVFLARDGFYDGVKFHRIIDGFMVQSGDPTGTGRGGPGYELEIEKPTQPEPYKLGSLAMANNTISNGSQFFIVNTEDINQKLEPNYTLMGQVTEGLDVLETISKTPVTQNPETGEPSLPTEDVLINSITIEEQ